MPTVVEQDNLIGDVEHRQVVVDVEAEIEDAAVFEVDFAVGIAVEVDAAELEIDFVETAEAGDVAGLEVDFAIEVAVEVDAGDAVELEVGFSVGIAVEVDAGNNAELGFEYLGFGILKAVLPKFVRGFQDAELQHTWSDSQ